MKKKFGLLGERLGHSYSPMIHGYLGNYEYKLYEITPSDLDAFMRQKRFDGINVTIPYKQAVIPYCASLSDEARKIGSVNTIIKDGDGLLHGHNTDYHGFRVMLERGGIDVNGKKALVLGNGGSARTVRSALTGLGAREVVTISRRGEDNYGNISRHYDTDIIVNTTPVGMYPNNGETPLLLAGFTRLQGVADLIYNPIKTKLLLEAERLGIPNVNGLTMLAAQAEMASRLFTTGHMQPAPTPNGTAPTPAPAGDAVLCVPPELDDIIAKMHRQIQNIALIGMPGCGKTTVGRTLAQITDRPFVDIDEQIESLAGKSIPEIFANDGEESFRSLETQALAEESAKSGMVIATGGGVVTRPENLDLLRQNSLIIYLRRAPTELESQGRPLSETLGVETLANRRIPLYETWCDHTIDVTSTPEQTAGMIMRLITEQNRRLYNI